MARYSSVANGLPGWAAGHSEPVLLPRLPRLRGLGLDLRLPGREDEDVVSLRGVGLRPWVRGSPGGRNRCHGLRAWALTEQEGGRLGGRSENGSELSLNGRLVCFPAHLCSSTPHFINLLSVIHSFLCLTLESGHFKSVGENNKKI